MEFGHFNYLESFDAQNGRAVSETMGFNVLSGLDGFPRGRWRWVPAGKMEMGSRGEDGQYERRPKRSRGECVS